MTLLLSTHSMDCCILLTSLCNVVESLQLPLMHALADVCTPVGPCTPMYIGLSPLLKSPQDSHKCVKLFLCDATVGTRSPVLYIHMCMLPSWDGSGCLHVTVLICTISCSLACNIVEPGMRRLLQQTDPQPRPVPSCLALWETLQALVCM